jgi:hypothetical protein
MVKTSKSEQQAALALAMELYFATSIAVQEDPDLEDDSDMGLIIDEGGDHPNLGDSLGDNTGYHRDP